MGRNVQTTVIKKAKTKMKKNKSYRPPMGKRKQQQQGESSDGHGGTQSNSGSNPQSNPMINLPSNPFELKINRRKQQVLGRVKKHEIGRPYEAKSKGIAKRNRTLMKEYKTQNKTNIVIDNRIGERKKDLDEEDKLAKRAALAKSRQYKKSSIFNLNDGDEDGQLTHKGFPLNQIERYDDPRELSDSEDERLDEDFVSEANFGGFLKFKKSNQNDDNDDEPSNSNGPPKSRDQIISELILQSKQRKFDKAKEQDDNFEKITQLDSEFKDADFQGLLLSYKQPTKEKKILPSLSELDIKLKEAMLRVSEPMAAKAKEKAKAKSVIKEAEAKGTEQKSDEDETMADMSKEERRNIRDEKKTSELIEAYLTLFKNTKAEFNPDKVDSQSILCELHALLVKNPHVTSNAFVNELQLLEQDFSDSHPKVISVRMLAYFSLCLTLFRFHKRDDGIVGVHKILTICAALMIEVINEAKPPSMKTLGAALNLTNQLHEISKESKGFCSESLRWLNHFLSVFNTFDSLPDKKQEKYLNATLNLTEKFYLLYKNFPTASDLFETTKKNLEQLETITWLKDKKELYDKVTKILESICSLPNSRLPFQVVKPKPTILKLYEPAFEDNFTGSTRRKMSRDEQQRSRLAHKIKKETKSAIRELKQDNAFLSRAQLKHQISLDDERKRKVSQLMGSLANQEGDYQKLKRAKK